MNAAHIEETRQIILGLLTDGREMEMREIIAACKTYRERVRLALRQLCHERVLKCEGPGPWLYSLWGDLEVVEL